MLPTRLVSAWSAYLIVLTKVGVDLRKEEEMNFPTLRYTPCVDLFCLHVRVRLLFSLRLQGMGGGHLSWSL